MISLPPVTSPSATGPPPALPVLGSNVSFIPPVALSPANSSRLPPAVPSSRNGAGGVAFSPAVMDASNGPAGGVSSMSSGGRSSPDAPHGQRAGEADLRIPGGRRDGEGEGGGQRAAQHDGDLEPGAVGGGLQVEGEDLQPGRLGGGTGGEQDGQSQARDHRLDHQEQLTRVEVVSAPAVEGAEVSDRVGERGQNPVQMNRDPLVRGLRRVCVVAGYEGALEDPEDQ